MHGSLTWKNDCNDEKISLDRDLSCVKKAKKAREENSNFTEAYEKLAIVNPRKEKFKETVLNRNYYELLRIYSAELEKENTVLFAMGFSFGDDHIKEITIRGANSNPTLQIYIIAHDDPSKEKIDGKFKEERLGNNNIKVISPSNIVQERERDSDDCKFDLATINKNIFNEILEKINEQ